MKKTNITLALGLLSILTVATGCESRTSTIDPVDSDIAERLPEDQRDIVLDEALAEIRSQRQVIHNADGSSIATSPGKMVTDELPGQSQNIPMFQLTEEDFRQMFEEIDAYFEAIGQSIDHDLIWNCIDPRMNAIYDDDDKGVAAGYENENIYLQEYETDSGFRFLIFVRESENAPWKLIHEGTSYKE